MKINNMSQTQSDISIVIISSLIVIIQNETQLRTIKVSAKCLL